MCPLDEARMHKLTVNGVKLLDCIDANSDFYDELANIGCITRLQREYLMNIVQPHDRKERLLDFLTRRSIADFEKFVKILSKSKEHACLVPWLVTDGGETFLMNK